MIYRWDPEKSDANHRDRGFGFDIMEDFNWDAALCLDIQFIDNEERELWIGPIRDRLYSVVITERDQTVRIISLRRATNTEITIWRKEIDHG